MSEELSFPGLDFSRSGQYTLFVHLCTDAFFFSIYNPLRSNHFHFLRQETDETLSLTANVKQVFERHGFLHHPFKRVNVVLETNRYTFIPFELFQEEQAQGLFTYSQSEQENEKVLHTLLPKCNIAALFGMDRFTYAWLTDFYPEAHFYGQMAPLAEYFCSQSRMTEVPELHVVIQEETINVLGFNRGRVVLANTFSYLSAEDLVYYLLAVWQQLELQPATHQLFVYGNSTHRAEAVEKLKRFIRHVETPELPRSIFGPKSENQSFTLQTLYLCE